MSNLLHNTNKRTNIKTYTFTYDPLRLQHISIFLKQSSGTLHRTRIYKTQMNYQID